jgi:hypothetical protein
LPTELKFGSLKIYEDAKMKDLLLGIAVIGGLVYLYYACKLHFARNTERLCLQKEVARMKAIMKDVQQHAFFDDKVAFFYYLGLRNVVSLQSTQCENWWLSFRLGVEPESKEVNIVVEIDWHPVQENNGSISMRIALNKGLITMSLANVLFDNVIAQFIETGEWKDSERNTPPIMTLSNA